MDTEGEERSDVISKIVSLVQQFAPSSMWQVDTLLSVLRLSTDHVHDEVLSTLAEVIGPDSDELACYTVDSLIIIYSRFTVCFRILRMGLSMLQFFKLLYGC